MTGLERLRELVDGMAEWSVFAVMKCEWCERHGVTVIDGRMAMKDLLSEIVDQIERETAHDPSKDVSMSAYDLLPECDRKAISLALDCGGVEEVKKRLMPAGMEWPRFETGEQVRIGDEFADGLGGTRVCTSVEFLACEEGARDVLIHWDGDDPDNAMLVCMASGERVKRTAPKVLDADGVEIRVGETVWDTKTGCGRTVRAVNDNGTVEFYDHENRGWFGKFLTHRAPVLAADGRPLREGETVWGTGREEHEYVILGQPGLGGGAGRFKVACHDVTDDVDCDCDPDLLTHERPVADTWERLEEDAGKEACEYFAHMPCGCETSEMLDETVEKCNAAKARDLVRRAKKLAGAS